MSHGDGDSVLLAYSHLTDNDHLSSEYYNAILCIEMRDLRTGD